MKVGTVRSERERDRKTLVDYVVRVPVRHIDSGLQEFMEDARLVDRFHALFLFIFWLMHIYSFQVSF